VWVLLGGSGEPLEAFRPAVDDLVNALTRPRAIVDFPPAPAGWIDRTEVATVAAWVNGFAAGAKPDDKPTGSPILLKFAKADETYAYAQKVAGKSGTFGRVNTALLNSVTKSRLDFVDPRVPSFVPAAVTRLAVVREKETLELERDASKDQWTWVKPEGLKGKPADGAKVLALLQVAGTISPGKVVAETPTDEKKKKFGFDPQPRLSVTVTLSPAGEKSLVYEFGAETGDKGYVYARHAGRTTVYTVPRVVFDRFRTEDLTVAPKAEAAPPPRPGK
jgi:hypothetical protein